MKKIGLIIFGSTVLVGVVFANFVSWGKASGSLVELPIHFGKIKGSGNVKTETRDLKDFDSLDVGGVFEVVATAGNSYSVEVEADDNLLEHINTEVDGSVLRISLDRRVSTSSPMRIRISAPNIESLEASGASNVKLSNVTGDQFRLESSGASKVNIAGAVKELRVRMSGASRVAADGLTTVDANIEASGASNLVVNASNELRVIASGASSIKYVGSPANVVKETSGGSSVRQN